MMQKEWPFDNSYSRLPDHFYTLQQPVPVALPELMAFNYQLAAELGLPVAEKSSGSLAAIFSGNKAIKGMEPLAQAYAGHQFGSFTILGDGRAILLGEVVTDRQERFDIQLKGSGRTPYSRGGDGRAALGPMLREYIVSEAMAALGVPTTRGLALVSSGETVYRPEEKPGAVLTRVARSHIRVGTFEFFLAHGDQVALQDLANYVIWRHFPEARTEKYPVLALYGEVLKRQAFLVAQWMLLGFVHGVMNTDNVSLVGETIDYGPCAFLDEYVPEKVFSSIDRSGRYRFSRQPYIAKWNVARFAETLLPVLTANGVVEAEARQALAVVLETFDASYQEYWLAGMRKKLGLIEAGSVRDQEAQQIAERWLELLAGVGGDFTNMHYALRVYAEGLVAGVPAPCSNLRPPEAELFSRHDFLAFLADWQKLLFTSSDVPAAMEAMASSNPAYIPRNHRIEQVIRQAEDEGDLTHFHELMAVLAKPNQVTLPEYQTPPSPEERVVATFCGT